MQIDFTDQHYTFDPLQDGKSHLSLIGVLGSDKDVVEDARTSFATARTAELTDKDVKLLSYLISHKHTSPLRGSVMKFRVVAPLFICRQWYKHAVASAHTEEQLGWNEQSFRYTEATDGSDYYVPEVFRKQSASNRQATEGQISEEDSDFAWKLYRNACDESYSAYRKLLLLGVGREQARAVLSPAFYTTWVWTASLQSVLHFISLRKGHGAQSEIALYAECIEMLVDDFFPFTLSAFNEAGRSF